METRQQILTELQEIAPFLGRSDIFEVPYTIPAGYFEGFADILMNLIRFEAAGYEFEANETFNESDVTGFSVKDEIKELSPLLAGLKNKTTYQVPEGYFENLRLKIPTTESIQSKLVAMPAKISNRKTISLPMRVIRYAAAACVVGLIGIVTFNITHPQSMADPIKSLTTISDQDMANYLDADDIHWTPGLSSSIETASADFSDGDIHELLSGVPDAELEQYSNALPDVKHSVN
jgi:hypothetical protein